MNNKLMKNLPIIFLMLMVVLGCNLSFNSSSNSQSNTSTNSTNKPTTEKPKEVAKDTGNSQGNKKTMEAGGGNCTIKEEVNVIQKNEYVKDYPISLNGGNYRVEYIHNIDKTKASPGFSVTLINTKIDPDGEYGLKAVAGNFSSLTEGLTITTEDGKYHKDGEALISKDLTSRYDKLRVRFWQGVGVDYIGNYEVKLVGEGCTEKKTITESESKFEGGECEFMDTVVVRQKYEKDYPIAIKNGNFQVEFAPEFDDNPRYRFGDFSLYIYDSKTDPKGEHAQQIIDGTTRYVKEGNEFQSGTESPEKGYQKGQAITSKPIPEPKYDRIRVTYWNGAGHPVVGSYRLKIVGAGCSGN